MPPITTAEVGVTRLTTPEALWKDVTTVARETCAKSARGARIGMAKVACPEVDGTRNARGRLSRNSRTPNTPGAVPRTADSMECSTVSVI